MMYLVLGYIKEINQFSRVACLEMIQYMKENSISFGKEWERYYYKQEALDMELPGAGLVFDSLE